MAEDKHHLSPRLHPHRLDDEAYRRVGSPVFVTLATAHRRSFLTTPGVPDRFVEAMDWCAAPRGTCVVCYCVMPDHVHLIACSSREDEDLCSFLTAVKKRSWFLFRDAGVEPPYWERSYWDRHARACEDLNDQVAYVLNQPVRAGLCTRAEDWPYSESRGFYVPDAGGHKPERGPASP